MGTEEIIPVLEKGETDNSIAFPVNKEEEETLEKFRERVKEDPDLISPLDTPFLLRILRWRKHDIENSMEALRGAWKLWDTYPELQKDVFDICMKHCDNHPYVVFGNRDEFGRQIVYCQTWKWDLKYSFEEMFRSHLCFVELLTLRQLTQMEGLVFILDLTGLTFSHVRAIAPAQMRLVVHAAQSLPLHLKAVHILHNPSFVNLVWRFIKPFLQPKLRERVQFHGADMTSLHKWISPKILPKSCGGVLSIEESLEAGFIEKVKERKDYVLEYSDPTKYGFHPDKKKLRSSKGG